MGSYMMSVFLFLKKEEEIEGILFLTTVIYINFYVM